MPFAVLIIVLHDCWFLSLRSGQNQENMFFSLKSYWFRCVDVFTWPHVVLTMTKVAFTGMKRFTLHVLVKSKVFRINIVSFQVSGKVHQTLWNCSSSFSTPKRLHFSLWRKHLIILQSVSRFNGQQLHWNRFAVADCSMICFLADCTICFR